MAARWNYFGADNEKALCDGIGGTAKRMANEAIRRLPAGQVLQLTNRY